MGFSYLLVLALPYRVLSSATKKIIREVTIPEVISVQELANRMATRSSEVVKSFGPRLDRAACLALRRQFFGD